MEALPRRKAVHEGLLVPGAVASGYIKRSLVLLYKKPMFTIFHKHRLFLI